MSRYLIILFFLGGGCSDADTVTQTTSSDSSIKAVDPAGQIRDTSQYFSDTTSQDTARGLAR